MVLRGFLLFKTTKSIFYQLADGSLVAPPTGIIGATTHCFFTEAKQKSFIICDVIEFGGGSRSLPSLLIAEPKKRYMFGPHPFLLLVVSVC
jgi:hypothetical protein